MLGQERGIDDTNDLLLGVLPPSRGQWARLWNDSTRQLTARVQFPAQRLARSQLFFLNVSLLRECWGLLGREAKRGPAGSRQRPPAAQQSTFLPALIGCQRLTHHKYSHLNDEGRLSGGGVINREMEG